MNKARILWIPTSSEPGYAWKWQNQEQESNGTFVYYYDCVTDARRHGHHVKLTRAVGQTAPGGASYSLQTTAIAKGAAICASN